MSRVVEVRDGRSIVVETGGIVSEVVLSGVAIPAGEAARAADYLRRELGRSWVYVEKGEVYRSPDGLHVNDAMRRRVWLGFTYLGEVNPAGRQPSRATTTSKPAKQKTSKRSRAGAKKVPRSGG